MNHLLQTAFDIQQLLDSRGWRHCVIGGLAVIRWGEPRLTTDVDLTVLVTPANEDGLIEMLLNPPYRGRVPDAAQFARRNRVLLLQANDDEPIDVALGILPYEAEMIARSSTFEYAPGCTLRTCSAEDLVVQKLFAFRERDRWDAKSVVLRQRDRLDWDAIEADLSPLAELKEQPEIMEFLADLRKSND